MSFSSAIQRFANECARDYGFVPKSVTFEYDDYVRLLISFGLENRWFLREYTGMQVLEYNTQHGSITILQAPFRKPVTQSIEQYIDSRMEDMIAGDICL